jgi:hypothetical protein
MVHPIVKEGKVMDKKPLIGVSILAVVLLVMGSLSNVVGYQSVKSTVNDSPLFNVRTQRASNQQIGIFKSDYLGKGRETNLDISRKDIKEEYIDKIINFFIRMDAESFNKFVNRFIFLFHQNGVSNLKVTDREIKDTLYQIKNNPEILKKYYLLMQEKGILERTFDNICLLALFLTIFLWPIFVLVFFYNVVTKIYENICIFFDYSLITVRGG